MIFALTRTAHPTTTTTGAPACLPLGASLLPVSQCRLRPAGCRATASPSQQPRGGQAQARQARRLQRRVEWVGGTLLFVGGLRPAAAAAAQAQAYSPYSGHGPHSPCSPSSPNSPYGACADEVGGTGGGDGCGGGGGGGSAGAEAWGAAAGACWMGEMGAVLHVAQVLAYPARITLLLRNDSSTLSNCCARAAKALSLLVYCYCSYPCHI